MKTIFKELLSKEARDRIKKADIYYARKAHNIGKLSNENLISTVKYYLTQMEAPLKYDPSAPVYESTFFHIIIPELLKRLEND